MLHSPYTRATDVLYQLNTITYRNKRHARYPRFKVNRDTAGFFHTLEDAETRIHKLVAAEKRAQKVGGYIREYYAFEIHEIPFDWELTGQSQRTRTYLEDGSFLHESLVSDIYYLEWGGVTEPFKGRSEADCVFAVGDFVEVLRDNTVTLEIVRQCPPTPARAEEIRQTTRQNILSYRPGVPEQYLQQEMDLTLDYSQDAYTTFDGAESNPEITTEPRTIQLFPPRHRISESLDQKLRKESPRVMLLT